MNRRQFTQSLAALFAAPALPAKALMAAPAATAGVPPPNLYTWSAMIARVHGKCSPAMLERMLHVDTAQAGALFNKLVANNVVGGANAVGVARAKALLPPQTGVQPAVIEPVAQHSHRIEVRLEAPEPISTESERAEETPARDPIPDDEEDG